MVKILGINAFHADASAALIVDGKIVNAIEEERFLRIKHCAGFPIESIKWSLKDAKIDFSEIDHIAINTNPKKHIFKKIFYTLTRKPDPLFLLDRYKNKRERVNLKKELNKIFPSIKNNAEIHYVEHHKSHLASAFYASSFDDSLVVSVDGFGDFSSCATAIGSKNKLLIKDYIFFPHSLGAFYTAITQFLGFPNYGDEYKVMGLAPYGRPRFMNEMRQIIKLENNGKFKLNLDYFNHSKKRIDNQWSKGAPVLGKHYSPNMIDLLGKERLSNQSIEQVHKDIASSAQFMYEEAFFNILNHLYKLNHSENICIAGGCGANSVANGKITKRTSFKKVYVQAAAGDAGGALGSALSVWHDLGHERCNNMGASYHGTRFSLDEVKSFLSSKDVITQLKEVNTQIYTLGDENVQDENQFLELICNFIENGLVVGWFEGRMEWGPRALGHRSIIGDPRRNDMKDILNLKIKKRESFRPFAPSVLHEESHKWFEFQSDLDSEVPYMMKVYPIKTDKRKLIPAVCHVDGTGRLQTVTEKDNDRYYRLIKCFYKKTGIPMLLNTSFNENEPIVSNLEQAFNCFKRTKMDVLVLENKIIKRN